MSYPRKRPADWTLPEDRGSNTYRRLNPNVKRPAGWTLPEDRGSNLYRRLNPVGEEPSMLINMANQISNQVPGTEVDVPVAPVEQITTRNPNPTGSRLERIAEELSHPPVLAIEDGSVAPDTQGRVYLGGSSTFNESTGLRENPTLTLEDGSVSRNPVRFPGPNIAPPGSSQPIRRLPDRRRNNPYPPESIYIRGTTQPPFQVHNPPPPSPFLPYTPPDQNMPPPDMSGNKHPRSQNEVNVPVTPVDEITWMPNPNPGATWRNRHQSNLPYEEEITWMRNPVGGRLERIAEEMSRPPGLAIEDGSVARGTPAPHTPPAQPPPTTIPRLNRRNTGPEDFTFGDVEPPAPPLWSPNDDESVYPPDQNMPPPDMGGNKHPRSPAPSLPEKRPRNFAPHTPPAQPPPTTIPRLNRRNTGPEDFTFGDVEPPAPPLWSPNTPNGSFNGLPTAGGRGFYDGSEISSETDDSFLFPGPIFGQPGTSQPIRKTPNNEIPENIFINGRNQPFTWWPVDPTPLPPPIPAPVLPPIPPPILPPRDDDDETFYDLPTAPPTPRSPPPTQSESSSSGTSSSPSDYYGVPIPPGFFATAAGMCRRWTSAEKETIAKNRAAAKAAATEALKKREDACSSNSSSSSSHSPPPPLNPNSTGKRAAKPPCNCHGTPGTSDGGDVNHGNSSSSSSSSSGPPLNSNPKKSSPVNPNTKSKTVSFKNCSCSVNGPNVKVTLA